jgi:hypothetical protein
LEYLAAAQELGRQTTNVPLAVEPHDLSHHRATALGRKHRIVGQRKRVVVEFT